MTGYSLVSTTAEHVSHVGLHMRQADVDEVWAASMTLPFDAVQLSVMGSRDPKTFLADDEPLCISGVGEGTLLGMTPAPWMLGTDALMDHVRPFLEESRRVVSGWAARYPQMANHVDARNRRAVRWLKWLGFTVLDPVPFGHLRLPFHPFYMVNEYV